MSWGYDMALISIKPTKRSGSLGLEYSDVMLLDEDRMITKLMLTQYGSVMVYCGRDMVGFYNGYVEDLLVGLGWNEC